MENTKTNIKALKNRKAELWAEVLKLNQTKKQLFVNVDIDSPISKDEKKIDRRIAAILSEINSIVLEILKAS